MRSAIVPTRRPCVRANSRIAGSRIIVPSSCMSSLTAADGCSPASRMRSTAASVWPARRSTPPSRARSGNTWPGRTRSAAVTPGCDGGADRERAILGGDAGVDALCRLDRHRVGGAAFRRVVLHHRGQLEVIGERVGHRQADDPTGVADREGDVLGGGVLGGDDDVALVLAVLVVDDDDGPPGA